jgi:DNA polymerase-1
MKLFLLDGHALVYRAHYSFMTRPLINSKGQNTSAATGFVKTLWDVLQKEKPTHLAVAFDLPTPTFRHEMYEPYKANRDSQPEDITAMFPYIFQIIDAMNIPIVTKDGYEADDVIGTLAKQAEKEGFEVYMMTPDKDYGQLVSDKVFMYKPGRQGNEVEIMGAKEVCEHWGITRPDQVIDMLGMQGDAVDNIPGLPGIGPKTAQTLIAKYDTMEGVIAHAHELKGKQQDIVKNFAEQGLLSKKLATIDLNVPVQFNAEEYAVKEMDRPRLSEIFKELEFRSLANQIIGSNGNKEISSTTQNSIPETQIPVQYDLFGNVIAAPQAPAVKKAMVEIMGSEDGEIHKIATKNIDNTPHIYHLVETKEERAALILQLLAQSEISFDTETTGIDANDAELVGLSFSFKEHEGYYIPVPADQTEALAIAQEFKEVLENEAIVKIGQNIKYDALMLKWYGIEVKGKLFDTMLAHYLIEPELRHNMNYMSETYLSYSPVSIETIGKKGKGQGTMRDVEIALIKEYAAEDADVTLQLKNYFAPQVKEGNLEKLFNDMELPLVKVLADIEYEGVNIDGAFLDEYSKELDLKIIDLEKKIIEMAGMKFNVASPKQVGEILFEKMRLPYKGKKMKSGQYSTDEEVLAELAPNHPIASEILTHRGLSKLKSTYVDALPRMTNRKTGRVHTNYNQALTSTGRLSSQNPNLQNIPIKTPEGSKVREAFVPRDADHLILSADYSQIELRLIAEISNDTTMLEAFQIGNDFHRATAAKVYDVALEDVTAEQRRNAKTVNFSITYGAGASNLSKQLGISRTEAKTLIENYFKQFQGLKTYMETVVNQAREHGYVETLLGRRRYLRDIDSRNSLARSNSERVAINSPIQGTAADMIKIAMINIHRALKEGNYKTKMILQVHDELVFDVYAPELEQVRPIIENGMKNAIPSLRVPIEVGMGVGKNWLEAH